MAPDVAVGGHADAVDVAPVPYMANAMPAQRIVNGVDSGEVIGGNAVDD